MSVVTLTFVGRGHEKVAGIPEFVEIISGVAATIYYTLDGSLPTPLSTLYSGPVQMPTDVSSVVLSAVGYYFDGYGLVPTTVLSNRYGPDWSELRTAKFLTFDGITYMYPGGLNIPYWYDSSGEASVFLDVPPEDLSFIVSDRNADGSDRDSEVDFASVPPEKTGTRFDDNFDEFSSDDEDTFNPDALFILIDGTKPQDPADVTLINGPHMSLRDPRRNFRGLDFYSVNGTNYMSGSMLRYHIDRSKGIMAFYYFDSNSSRWVKSIQPLANTLNTVSPIQANSTPLVFKWNNYGRVQNF